MKTLVRSLLTSILLVPTLLLHAQQLTFPADYLVGTRLDASFNSVDYTRVDNEGNLWVMGTFGRTSVGAGGPGSLWAGEDTVYSDNDWDLFLQKIGPNGEPLFIKSFGCDVIDFHNGFDIHPDGGAVVYFQLGSATVFNGVSYASATHLVVDFDADGNIKWVKSFGGGTFVDALSSMAFVNDDGDVVVSGILLPASIPGSGPTNFEGQIIPATTQAQVFVAKYAGSDGSQTISVFEANTDVEVKSAHKGVNGHFWLSVRMLNGSSLTLDGLTMLLPAEDQNVLVEFDENAQPVKMDSYFTYNDIIRIFPLPDGSLQILGLGIFNNTTENATGTTYPTPTSSGYNLLLYRINPAGLAAWIKPVLGFYAADLSVNSVGTCLLTLKGNLLQKAFSLYDSLGNEKQSLKINAPYNAFSLTANFDNDDNLYLAGSCDEKVTVGGQTLTFGTPQERGFFFAKIPDSTDTYRTLDLSYCSPLLFHGSTFTESGTYTVIIPNSCNGDSIITLNYTALKPSYASFDVSTCLSYTVPSGDETYTVSGTYMDTVYNSIFCDSVLTINLTINDDPVNIWGVTPGGGVGAGTIFTLPLCGTTTGQFNMPLAYEGHQPRYTKLQELNGKLYGLTSGGGINNQGVIYTYNLSTKVYEKHADLSYATGSNPYGSLTLASNGKMYGLTLIGGLTNRGAVIEFDPATEVLTNKYDITDPEGATPYGSLVEAPNGKMYGMVSSGGANQKGTIIEYVPGDIAISKIFDFDGVGTGSMPIGNFLVGNDGLLYGMTSEGGANNLGVLFTFDYTTATYTKKLDFDGANGSNPFGTLMQASDGMLYGLTKTGGTTNLGTLFQYDITTSTLTQKHSFDGTPTGKTPHGELVQTPDGLLLGLCKEGGQFNGGTLFDFDPISETLTRRSSLESQTTGSGPEGSLVIASDGKLYGTAFLGGQNSGTVFSYEPVGQQVSLEFNFNTDALGGRPSGSLLQASNDKLYGVTREGGLNNAGTLYEYDIVTGTHIKLIDMSFSTTGTSPNAGLIQAANGKLYGTTNSNGGAGGRGTIYEYEISTNTFTKKVQFTGTSTGAKPYGELMEASNGKLYGITWEGGSSNFGVIYEFDPSTDVFTKLFDFTGTATGAKPYGELLEAENGKLLGMTQLGGSDNKGVLFEYDITTATFTKKIDFTGTNGANPYGSLTKALNGKIYGLTSGVINTNNDGTLFEYDLSTGALQTKFSFGPNTGQRPVGTLMQASNKKLYGMTSSGGGGQGVVFEYDLTTEQCEVVRNFTGPNGSFPSYGRLIEISDCSVASEIAQSTDVSCFGKKDGTATVTVVGGELPYLYTWMPEGGSANLAKNLPAGFYTVTVLDGKNCETTASVTLTQPADPTVSLPDLANACVDHSPRTIPAGSPSGGTYSGPGVTGNSFDPMTAGVGTHAITYTYTNSDGCSYDAVQEIIVDACTGINENSWSQVVLSPNPTNKEIRLEFGKLQLELTIVLRDINGRILTKIENINALEYTLDVSDLAAGAYLVELSNQRGMARKRFLKY